MRFWANGYDDRDPKRVYYVHRWYDAGMGRYGLSEHRNDSNQGKFKCRPPQCDKGIPDGTPIKSVDKGPAECSAYCRELRCLKGKGQSPAALARVRVVESLAAPGRILARRGRGTGNAEMRVAGGAAGGQDAEALATSG